MVALLAMAVALCLVPFSTLLGLIEKLKYGEFEVLPRDLTKLNAAVQVVANSSAESESQAVSGGTSRKGNLCTLRRGGGVSRASERSEATLGHPLIVVPGVIAREIDVLPAKRRDVL